MNPSINEVVMAILGAVTGVATALGIDLVLRRRKRRKK